MKSASKLQLVIAAVLLVVSSLASATGFMGEMSCGQLQNIPKAKSIAPFMAPVTLSVDGNRAALDRVWLTGSEHSDGFVVIGQPLQLEGRGQISANPAGAWKLRTTLTKSGQRYEGTAIMESLDGKTKYRDCTVSLETKDVAVNAGPTDTVAKAESVQAPKPKTEELLPLPALARVVDQTGTLSDAQRVELEAKLTTIEGNVNREVAVVIVRSTKPEDIHSYATRLGNVWKVGNRKGGKGILILVAKDDRKIRIEVSKKLAAAMSDVTAKEIIDKYLTPAFRTGEFATGLNTAVDELSGMPRQSAAAATAPPVSSKPSGVALSAPVAATSSATQASPASQPASSNGAPATVSGPATSPSEYRVVALHAPTTDELNLVRKSEAKKFLDEGGSLTTASVDLDQDGVTELVAVAQSSAWCGSGGCASLILKTDAGGAISSFENDCVYFGVSEKFGVGNTMNGRFATLYPLDDKGQIVIMDKPGMPETGKSIVCKVSPRDSVAMSAMPVPAVSTNTTESPKPASASTPSKSFSFPDLLPNLSKTHLILLFIIIVVPIASAFAGIMTYRVTKRHRERHLLKRESNKNIEKPDYSVAPEPMAPAVAIASEDSVAQSRSAAPPDISPTTPTAPSTSTIRKPKIDDSMAWLMAFVPLMGEIVERAINPLIVGDPTYGIIFSYLLVYLVLLIADDKRIRATGQKGPGIGWIVLIPVYLWRRAVILKHKPSYFWVWIVAFSIPLLLDNGTFLFGSNFPASLSISSPFDSAEVKQVKGGTMELCPAHTVEQMVNGFMGSPTWKSGKTAEGQLFVNVNGGITYANKPVRATLQFFLDGNRFQFNALELNGVATANLIGLGIMSKMCGSATSVATSSASDSSVSRPSFFNGFSGDARIIRDQAERSVHEFFTPIMCTSIESMQSTIIDVGTATKGPGINGRALPAASIQVRYLCVNANTGTKENKSTYFFAAWDKEFNRFRCSEEWTLIAPEGHEPGFVGEINGCSFISNSPNTDKLPTK